MRKNEAPVTYAKQLSVMDVQHAHQLIELSAQLVGLLPQLAGWSLQLFELSPQLLEIVTTATTAV